MKAARLVVLGIAVAAGGVAAILAGGYQSAPPPPAPAPAPQIAMIDILVAKNDIGIGVALSAGDLQWQSWPASAGNPAFVRKSEHPDAIQQYTGAIVRVAMAAGEPVRENKIIKANGSGFLAAILPAGMRATSVPIAPETGASGFILPNDRVDVILAGRDHDAEKANGYETRLGHTILTDVRVLAIGQTVQEKDGQRVVDGKTATLEVTEAQAEMLQAALQTGTLSLTLRSLADAKPSSHPETTAPSQDVNRFNMIRFGVPITATAK